MRPDSTRLQVRIEGGQTEVEWLLNGRPLEQSGQWAGPGINEWVLTNVQVSALGQYAVRLRNPLGETVAEVVRVSLTSWSRANLPTASWNSVAISGTGAGVIHQSDDGGQTWRWSGSPSAKWTAIACSADGWQSGVGRTSKVTRCQVAWNLGRPDSAPQSDGLGLPARVRYPAVSSPGRC
jgi:hypothetical protein